MNNPWATRHHPGAQAKRFGEIMKCPTGNSKEMVACMKAASSTAVMEAHRSVVVSQSVKDLFRRVILGTRCYVKGSNHSTCVIFLDANLCWLIYQ